MKELKLHTDHNHRIWEDVRRSTIFGDSVFGPWHPMCVFDMLIAWPMPLGVSTLESIDLWRIILRPEPRKDELDLRLLAKDVGKRSIYNPEIWTTKWMVERRRTSMLEPVVICDSSRSLDHRNTSSKAWTSKWDRWWCGTRLGIQTTKGLEQVRCIRS